MDIDEYHIEQDFSFPAGEQYFFYKGSELVGWMRLSLGLIRVAATYPPSSLLLCAPASMGSFDSFKTGKERRDAFIMAISVLNPSSRAAVPSPVLSVFGAVDPVSVQQTLF